MSLTPEEIKTLSLIWAALIFGYVLFNYAAHKPKFYHMNTLQKLPDLNQSVQLMAIANSLSKLKGGGIIGHAIQDGLQRGSVKSVVKMIQDHTKINRPAMQRIVGTELLEEIEGIIL